MRMPLALQLLWFVTVNLQLPQDDAERIDVGGRPCIVASQHVWRHVRHLREDTTQQKRE